MIDRLKRFREPAALVALLVVLFECGATLVRFFLEARTTPATTVMRGTTGLFGLVDAMVLTALVLACVMVAPVTRWARQLTLGSAIVMTVGALAGVVFLLGALLDPAGWFSRLLESLGGFAEIIFKGLFAWLLWNAYRAVVDSEAEAARPAPDVVGQAVVPPDPTRQPIWTADTASGAVWRRAGDAAMGAAATGVGEAGDGWTPIATPDLPAIRPDGALLPPVPGDPEVLAAAEQEAAAAPPASRAVRVIVGEDEPGARRSGPPSWDPADDVSRPARGL